VATTEIDIGSLSTVSTYEWVPAQHNPAFKLWIASTGEAVVAYWYPDSNHTHNIYAFRYSNADRTAWSDEIVMASYATDNYNTDINRLTAWKAPNSDDVAVCWLCYQNVRNYTYACILHHAPTGGWYAGDVESVNTSPYDLSGGNHEVQTSHDGSRQWVVLHSYEGYYEMWPYVVFYRWSGNPNWYTALLPWVGGAKVACSIGSGNGFTIAVYLNSPVRGDPTDINVMCQAWAGMNAVGGEQTLWTRDGHGLTTNDDRQNMGLAVYYIGHPNADFIVTCRIWSDESLRIWKYKIGVGWTGEVVLKDHGAAANCTHGVWDADAGIMYFWYTSSATVSWNPDNDAVDEGGMPGRANQMLPVVFQSKLHGFSAGGSGGTSYLHYYYMDRSFLRRMRKDLLTESRFTIDRPIGHTLRYESRVALFNGKGLPLAATGWVYPDKKVPEEYREWIGRVDCPGHHEDLVFEKLKTDRIQHETGLEWQGTLQNGIWIKTLPLDVSTTLSRNGLYQIEYRKAWPWRTEPFGTDLWIEVLKGLWTTQRLVLSYVEPIVVVAVHEMALALDMPIGTVVQIPWDSEWPLTATVYHTWDCLRMSLGILPHTWRVFNVAGTPSVQHSWTVLSVQGASLAHLWRVMPPEFLILHGEDIQLLFANLDKKS
jgi:hypothetical protein